MLVYLKTIEWKLIDMFSTPSVDRKINNANCNGYVNEKVNEEMDSGDTCHAEGDEVKIENLLDMSPQEGDKKQVKLEPEETIAGRVKLNHRKRKSQEQDLKS